MILRYTDIPDFLPQTIKGIVCDEKNRLPLDNVLVYVMKGVEETITDSNGEFVIATWQHFPLILTIKNKGCPEIKKEVNNVSEKPVIFLVQQ